MQILQCTKRTLSLIVILCFFTAPAHSLFALETYNAGVSITSDTTFRFNSENWFTAPHPKVASFTILDDGSAYGLLETGIPFYQDNVPNTLNIRVQRFSIQDHHHYIIEGKEVYTFEALSIELARVYNEKNTQA